MHRHAAPSGEVDRRELMLLGLDTLGTIRRGRADFGKRRACLRIREPRRKAVERGAEFVPRDRRQDHGLT